MGIGVADQGIAVCSRTLTAPADRGRLRRLIGEQPGAVILESLGEGLGGGRYSIFAFDPVQVLSIGSDGERDPFVELTRLCRPWGTIRPSVEWPLAGGWIGYLSYEAGGFVEPRAGCWRASGGLPMAHWGLYDTLLVHDRGCDRWTAVAVELPPVGNGGWRPPAEHRLEQIARLVEQTHRGATSRGRDSSSPTPGGWNLSRGEHLARIERALEYIRAGDIFQVNLARRYRAAWSGSGVSLYDRLCSVNPAGYAAYVGISPGRNEQAVVSCSPELFVDVQNDTLIATTRPIKGTRPRTGDTERDRAARRELAACEKERAELNMIIDLERNDLGRVCDYGTVRVVENGQIEEHPTVFHRSATVVGRLREGLDGLDAMRAMFPGGSITGAPKVRAMQIIQELEPDARGPYCGAIGYIGLDGQMQLNLAIRTMAVHDGVVDLWAGSGIVADSSPEAEHEETLAKAAGMMRAIHGGKTEN